MTTISKLPLLYDFTTLLPLKDEQHTALVQVAGKALVEEDSEEGETTIYAVDPGSFWGLGATFEDAWADFYKNLKVILEDLAAESESPVDFRASVDRLLAMAHQGLQEDWEFAAEARRNGESAVTHDLPIQESYLPRGIQVVFKALGRETSEATPSQPKLAA